MKNFARPAITERGGPEAQSKCIFPGFAVAPFVGPAESLSLDLRLLGQSGGVGGCPAQPAFVNLSFFRATQPPRHSPVALSLDVDLGFVVVKQMLA